MEMDKNEIFCSFCGENRSKVRTMIAGANVYICNECVRKSYNVLEEENDFPFWNGELKNLRLKDIKRRMNIGEKTFLSKTVGELIEGCIDLYQKQHLRNLEEQTRTLRKRLKQISLEIEQNKQRIQEVNRDLEKLATEEERLKIEVENIEEPTCKTSKF